MGMVDKMMDMMLGGMSQEDREQMMDRMMEKFFGDMSVEEKQKMMLGMMPKMMEGVSMADMMPQMMAAMMSGMTGGRERGGGMMQMMASMMGGSQGVPASGDDAGAEAPAGMPGMPGMPDMPGMMTEMMPHCLSIMLPGMPREERVGFILRLVGILKDAGSAGMSDDEKEAFTASLLEKVTGPD